MRLNPWVLAGLTLLLLAAMAGVPIVPIYHNGLYRFFIGRRWRMMIGEPITVTPPPEGPA